VKGGEQSFRGSARAGWPSRLLATAALVLLALGIAALITQSRFVRSTAPAYSTPSAASTTSATQQFCPAPAERPAYLPSGFDSPPTLSRVVYQTDGSREQGVDETLAWEGRSNQTVSLLARDTHEYLDLPGQPWERTTVHGRPAVIVWVGDPFIGPVNIIWPEREGACGTYVLSATLRQLPVGLPAGNQGEAARALQREAARMAESLR